jgi:serine phosphatase RsbU (regulator of sigma subunit)
MELIKRDAASRRGRPVGAPGLLANISYDQKIVKPLANDLVMLYSDGVTEASNKTGNQLGHNGLINIAQKLDVSSGETFDSQLTSAMRRFQKNVEPTDDETIIVPESVALRAT